MWLGKLSVSHFIMQASGSTSCSANLNIKGLGYCKGTPRGFQCRKWVDMSYYYRSLVLCELGSSMTTIIKRVITFKNLFTLLIVTRDWASSNSQSGSIIVVGPKFLEYDRHYSFNSCGIKDVVLLLIPLTVVLLWVTTISTGVTFYPVSFLLLLANSYFLFLFKRWKFAQDGFSSDRARLCLVCSPSTRFTYLSLRHQDDGGYQF